MSNAANFKREAERYRKVAKGETKPQVAQRMLDFAAHYDGLAAILEEAERPPKAQHQPVQQQQSRTKLEDDL
jgi:hypothetical protein